nr:probable cytochrome P450 6a20 [Onthophagus taurus]
MEVFIFALLTLTSLVYYYYKKSFQYWEKKGVAQIKPSFPFGNIENPMTSKGGTVMNLADLHKQFKAKGEKIGGIYAGATPMLLIVDPEWVKNIVSKDFNYFNSHAAVFDEKDEPLEAHLFNLEGARWKDMRVKMTPTFTSGKMKMMFDILLVCGNQLEEFIDSTKQDLDIKEILACFTTDVIGSCAFGLECNSFKNPNAEFRSHGRKLFESSLKFRIRNVLTMISPTLVKSLKLHFTDKCSSKFFRGVVKDTFEYRKSKNVTRNDFMQLLINMEQTAKENNKSTYSIDEMAAQAFVFFLAGFETSSTTMTFCLYELAHHQDIQDKLRKEINETIKKHGGKLTYDAIMDMKYMEQVINETLRMYPPVHTLPRLCTQTYTLPNGSTIEKGTNVFISLIGLQRDEEYFPEPNKFNPDRFSDENKRNITPYTFLPFGEGPRICIGLRFGMMQTKVGLSLILKNYKVSPHESLSYPMEFDNQSVILSSKGKIMLKHERV